MNSIEAFDLTGKTALVTGVSRGLGQIFARALAEAGASLIITSRNKGDLDEFATKMSAMGVDCETMSLDVTLKESVDSLLEAIRRLGKSVDILVNNAGCNVRKPSLEITWEDWDKVLDTNLKGTFFVSQAIASQMIEQKYGRIINVGSVTRVFGYAGLAPYGASRGGVKQMTMSLADDWGKYGITVNCLAPGWFKTAQNAVMYEDKDWVDYLTERIPLGRPGQPHDLKGAVVFLASEASRYVTGQTLLVDGGITTGSTRALPRK